MLWNFRTCIAPCLWLSIVLALAALPAAVQGQEDSVLLAGSIIDADVYDEREQLIGEVDDLIIRRSGRVKSLTVEFGGFFDLGDDLVSLPFGAFEMKKGGVAIEATTDELREKPEINYYEKGLRTGYYYQTGPYAGRYNYPPQGYYYYYNGPNVPRRPMADFDWAFSPARFLASVIMDRRVVNEERQEIGVVADLALNRETSEVENIIIAAEDVLGEGVYVAVAYEPLGFTPYGLVYDISPEVLKDFVYPYQE